MAFKKLNLEPLMPWYGWLALMVVILGCVTIGKTISLKAGAIEVKIDDDDDGNNRKEERREEKDEKKTEEEKKPEEKSGIIDPPIGGAG